MEADVRVKKTVYIRQERRSKKLSPQLIALSVLGVAALVYVTLCPLAMRPVLVGSPNMERFAGFLVIGFVVAFTLRRQWLQAAVFMVLLAFALEAAQLLIPDRHGKLPDAVVKAFGGVMGAGLAAAFYPLRRKFDRVHSRLARSADRTPAPRPEPPLQIRRNHRPDYQPG